MDVLFHLLFLLSCFQTGWGAFQLVREHSGQNFFDGWDFYGSWDNLTLGNASWVTQTQATSEHLAYINSAGNAIMKVDNTTTVTNGNIRDTVRITSQDFYDFGSLWIVDMLHIPYGCSVWPAFWSKGTLWPNDGEIDIVEAINLMGNNQMALHTTAGCIHTPPPDETGHSNQVNCGQGSGCVVAEATPNSYGPSFAAAGGGVWATQFDVSGIYIWFWGRANIPPSITQATSTSSIDISQWGPPSASYPTNSQCNITNYFTPQQLVFDITLCGDWAGVPGIYDNTCRNAGPANSCYLDNVVGPGSPKYDDAYFEVSYVRAYTAGTPAPTTAAPTPASGGVVQTLTTTEIAGTVSPSFAASNSTHQGAQTGSGARIAARSALLAFALIGVGAVLV